MSTTTTTHTATPAIDFADFFALQQLYADYASALDAADWDRWPGFFTADCVYRLQPRENHERGLPLATLSFDSQGMLKDRVYGIRETLFHDPYYQRHVIRHAPRARGGRGPLGMRGELRRVPHQAVGALHRVQRGPLPRRGGAHARRAALRPQGMHLRQRNDPEFHHLPHLIRGDTP